MGTSLKENTKETLTFRSSNPGSKSPRRFVKRRISTFFATGAEFGFEFWVLGFAQRHDQITNCVRISPKTQNSKPKTQNQPHHAVPLWCSAFAHGDSASGQG